MTTERRNKDTRPDFPGKYRNGDPIKTVACREFMRRTNSDYTSGYKTLRSRCVYYVNGAKREYLPKKIIIVPVVEVRVI